MTEATTETQHTEVTRFWRHLFGGQRGLLQVWTGIRNEEGKISRETARVSNFNYPNAAESAATWALEKAGEEREVYYCAHLLTAAKRIKANAAPVRSLWGDLDGAPVPNGELKPTAVVESSPGKFHAYWRLDTEIPPETAEDLNRRIAGEINADPSGFDLSQLLRVPGTKNRKYAAAPEVRLLDLDGGRTYNAAELDNLLPASEEPKAAYNPDEDASDEPPVVLTSEALKVWRGEKPKLKDNGEVDRSATLLHIGRVLFDAGANRRIVVEDVRERDKALGFCKYSDNRDSGRREYERIFEKLEEEGRNSRVRVTVGGNAPTPTEKEWPQMDEAAYRGIFGRLVETVEPHTEGDPVAVLTGAIAAAGNAMGRGPYMQIGATKHRTNLFIAHVGATAKGRKGSAWNPVKDIHHAADKEWVENRIVSGLSSGEGLINEVRDKVQVPGDDGKMKTTDPGVKDKRLLVMEGELSQVLKVMKREGNTLSPVVRNAWDGETLRTLVKHSPLRATDPHISIAGHITLSELTRYLTETEMANGLANRFQWFLVKRSKSLPFGGEWHTANLTPVTRKLAGILSEYEDRNVRMIWGEDARALWCEAYEVLIEDREGMFGAITARAEAQALRLAMIYALADYSQEIRRSHVESALAVWEYAEASALYIFGDATGDPDADKVLVALKDAAGGMTRTEIRDLFGRNKSGQELDRIREALIKARKLRVSLDHEGGSKKPVERWYAA